MLLSVKSTPIILPPKRSSENFGSEDNRSISLEIKLLAAPIEQLTAQLEEVSKKAAAELF